MKHLLNRIEVYSRYFFEYIRYGEFTSLRNAIHYMITRTSNAKGGKVKSRLGVFETRPLSLDFQHVNYAYELSIKKFIEKEDFTVFFDIGACLGEFSIWLARKGKKCIAFEPVRYSYEMIQRNINLNHVENNIMLFQCGLGSKHAEAHFELNETNPGSNRRVDVATEHTEVFVINTLDELLPSFNLSPTDKILIKIDVEGMELEMLAGAQHFINSYDNIVMIIEEKFSGEDNIRKGLLNMADFEFGQLDEHNIYARKVKQHT
jgi:FkbM family methyltransferase